MKRFCARVGSSSIPSSVIAICSSKRTQETTGSGGCVRRPNTVRRALIAGGSEATGRRATIGPPGTAWEWARSGTLYGSSSRSTPKPGGVGHGRLPFAHLDRGLIKWCVKMGAIHLRASGLGQHTGECMENIAVMPVPTSSSRTVCWP